jgi:hypothetical protein
MIFCPVACTISHVGVPAFGPKRSKKSKKRLYPASRTAKALKTQTTRLGKPGFGLRKTARKSSRKARRKDRSLLK